MLAARGEARVSGIRVSEDAYHGAMRGSKALWRVRAILNKIPGAYRMFRYITTHLGEGKVYRIRTGTMKGFRWRRYNTLNFWYHLGLFEPHVSRLVEGLLRPGDCFWDVGANGGYHSLLAARTVGPKGSVLAVEANPFLAPLIEEQLRLNDITNCSVLSVAISDHQGQALLVVDDNSLKSTLSDMASNDAKRTIEVNTTTLDALAGDHPLPSLIKIDVEGAESGVLLGAVNLLRNARATVLVSTHGEKSRAECKRILQDVGYVASAVPGFDQMLCARPDRPLGSV
jgi:FkbM family methyltransferase